MNRAPVALFALLCTLASSMVAVGVASDRPATVGNCVTRNVEHSELKTISYSGSPADKWLIEPNWQAIDVERAVALPTRKIPTRIPEKVKPVAAIIITIEQAPAAAQKVATKPAAAKPIAAKPAAKPVAAKPTVAQKAVAANNAAKTEQAVKAVMSVVSKMSVAAKNAPIQPRITASFSTTYVPTKDVRDVLSTNRISIADLHLTKPAVATTNGSVTALPINNIAASNPNSSMVTVGGGKLQIAYGSLSLIKVGGNSFIPTPFIADDATSILLNKAGTSSATKSGAKTAAKPQNGSTGFSVWSWTGGELARLQHGLLRTFDRLGKQFSRQVNEAATIYIGQIRGFDSAQWIPLFDGEKGTIKSAQLKTGGKPSVTK